jgi:hypothetical protein
MQSVYGGETGYKGADSARFRELAKGKSAPFMLLKRESESRTGNWMASLKRAGCGFA